MVLAALPGKEEAGLPFLGPAMPDDLARAIADGAPYAASPPRGSTREKCHAVRQRTCRAVCRTRDLHRVLVGRETKPAHGRRGQTQPAKAGGRQGDTRCHAGDLDPMTKQPFPERPPVLPRQPLHQHPSLGPNQAKGHGGSASGESSAHSLPAADHMPTCLPVGRNMKRQAQSSLLISMQLHVRGSPCAWLRCSWRMV